MKEFRVDWHPGKGESRSIYPVIRNLGRMASFMQLSWREGEIKAKARGIRWRPGLLRMTPLPKE